MGFKTKKNTKFETHPSSYIVPFTMHNTSCFHTATFVIGNLRCGHWQLWQHSFAEGFQHLRYRLGVGELASRRGVFPSPF